MSKNSESTNINQKLKNNFQAKTVAKKKEIHVAFKIIAALAIIITILAAFRSFGFQYVDNVLFVFIFGNTIKYLAYSVVIYVCLCTIFSYFLYWKISQSRYGFILLLLITVFLFGIIGEWQQSGGLTRGDLGSTITNYADQWANQGFTKGNANVSFQNELNGGFFGVIFYVIVAGIFSPPLTNGFGVTLVVIAYLIAISLVFTGGLIRLYVTTYHHIVYRLKTNKQRRDEYYRHSNIKSKLVNMQDSQKPTISPEDSNTHGNVIVNKKLKRKFRTQNIPVDKSQTLRQPTRKFDIKNHMASQTATMSRTNLHTKPLSKMSRKERIAYSKRNYEEKFNIPDFQSRVKKRKNIEQSMQSPIPDYAGKDIYKSFERTRPIPKRNLSKTQEQRVKNFDRDFIDINPFGMSSKEREKYTPKVKKREADIKIDRYQANSYNDTTRFVNPNDRNRSREDDVSKKS